MGQQVGADGEELVERVEQLDASELDLTSALGLHDAHRSDARSAVPPGDHVSENVVRHDHGKECEASDNAGVSQV